jgi:hypothetical protein
MIVDHYFYHYQLRHCCLDKGDDFQDDDEDDDDDDDNDDDVMTLFLCRSGPRKCARSCSYAALKFQMISNF